MSALNLGVFTFISNSLQRTQSIMFLPETCSKFWIFFLSIYRENFHQGEGRMALTELRFNRGRNAERRCLDTVFRASEAGEPAAIARTGSSAALPQRVSADATLPSPAAPCSTINAAPMDPTRNAASHSVRGKTGNHARASS